MFLIFIMRQFFIGIPVAFSLKISPFGNYFYIGSKGVYYNSSSDFSKTVFGQIILGVTSFFLNFFQTLLVEIILNVQRSQRFCPVTVTVPSPSRHHPVTVPSLGALNRSTSLSVLNRPKPSFTVL